MRPKCGQVWLRGEKGADSPNLSCTNMATILPTWVLPVNETRSTRSSFDIAVLWGRKGKTSVRNMLDTPSCLHPIKFFCISRE